MLMNQMAMFNITLLFKSRRWAGLGPSLQFDDPWNNFPANIYSFVFAFLEEPWLCWPRWPWTLDSTCTYFKSLSQVCVVQIGTEEAGILPHELPVSRALFSGKCKKRLEAGLKRECSPQLTAPRGWGGKPECWMRTRWHDSCKSSHGECMMCVRVNLTVNDDLAIPPCLGKLRHDFVVSQWRAFGVNCENVC